ncbi:hypothetical protein EHP00_2577 [Ecytonucleospora hepatopenaei]|uniref:Uncharacterized protein n=1 Tax=Ecytonucleospora hepatopenaei TaxID=646526 RepID=A0A1W0E861_9MICR|nr:hypothetical protein EHP00_2577 [Ecytonucleospora hepatopenaei]
MYMYPCILFCIFKVLNILCATGNTKKIQKENIAEQQINKLHTLVDKIATLEKEYTACKLKYNAINTVSRLVGINNNFIETHELNNKVVSSIEELYSLEQQTNILTNENIKMNILGYSDNIVTLSGKIFYF